jgi:hypothetical protein
MTLRLPAEEAVNRITSRAVVWVPLAAGLGVAACLRGGQMFGPLTGVVYGAAALLFVRLLARCRPPVRAALLSVAALPVGYVLAFPTTVNPDVQVAIDKQAADRAAHRELGAVFVSDPAFRRLSVRTEHLIVDNVLFRGRLPSRAEFRRLRGRVAAECPTASGCPLHWDVALDDTGERLRGLDRDPAGG